jgi:large subunit ribosomal protein L15
MLQLNNLTPLCKKRKRIGRGGSRGGTSGRGHKGQKARTGGASKVRSVFEGGQSPLTRRLPKRGFNNASFATRYEVINLDVLDRYFDDGAVINKASLVEHGLLSNSQALLVKILGRGSISKKFTVYVDAWSKGAQESIESKGGKVLLHKETT